MFLCFVLWRKVISEQVWIFLPRGKTNSLFSQGLSAADGRRQSTWSNMGVGILRQHVLNQVLVRCGTALFAIFPRFLSSLTYFNTYDGISLVPSSRGTASLQTINNLTCVMRRVGCLSLLMAPINHLFICAHGEYRVPAFLSSQLQATLVGII